MGRKTCSIKTWIITVNMINGEKRCSKQYTSCPYNFPIILSHIRSKFYHLQWWHKNDRDQINKCLFEQRVQRTTKQWLKKMHWMIVDSLVMIIHGPNLWEIIVHNIIARFFHRLETDYTTPELKNSLNDIIIYSWEERCKAMV